MLFTIAMPMLLKIITMAILNIIIRIKTIDKPLGRVAATSMNHRSNNVNFRNSIVLHLHENP